MPADEAYEFAVAVPAGTTQALPLVTPTRFPNRYIRLIRWRFPPGSLGVTGIRVSMGGVQVIPANKGAWIVASGESGEWELPGLPDSGSWDVTAYNLGGFPHTVYVTFVAVVPAGEPEPAWTWTDEYLSDSVQ